MGLCTVDGTAGRPAAYGGGSKKNAGAACAAQPSGLQGCARAVPHRRQLVMSWSYRFAHFYQEWHSCVVQTEERSLCSDEYLRESQSLNNWSMPFLPTGKT